MSNYAEIIYTANNFANNTSVIINYPPGLQFYMFQPNGSHAYILGGVTTSAKNNFEIVFGASSIQVTNTTGAALNGEITFNLALHVREPSDAVSASVLLVEHPSRDDFPALGSTGRIYVDTAENIIYRWTGERYAILPSTFDAGTA